MFDIVGNEIKVGDFVVWPGRGNRSAECGLILMRVTDVGEYHLRCDRLDVEYQLKPEFKTIAKKRSVRISNPNKLAVVNPSAKAIEIFENYTAEPGLVGIWVHGTRNIFSGREYQA